MIKYVEPVRPSSAKGLVAEVYGQVKRDFGAVVEPFAVHASAPELLAGVWGAWRETVAVGKVRRDVKEAVSSVVSAINECPYCVDAHTMMLHAARSHDAAAAIARGRHGELEGDPELARVIEWAAATGSPGPSILASPPFEPGEAPEIIGTALVFHYINRVVTILLSESPLPGKGQVRRVSKRLAALWFARALRRAREPGVSLRLLPEAALPADLEWAAASPAVAGALSRWVAAVERAAGPVVGEDVHELVSDRLAVWNGEDPGLSRSWVEESVTDLGGASRNAARLALLAALAPYQVDDDVIHEFREGHPEDEHLIALIAWSSLSAARRIASWLNTSAPSSTHAAGLLEQGDAEAEASETT
jgi:AhpD family alkylhydroperoxidase